jgi:predicted Rossmann fold flavoprotein
MVSPEIDTSLLWDVAVVGGGPAGMMAAGRAAENGAKVILIEKNKSLGNKLLITGGGRCNVTNAEFDNRKLLENFKENGKYLFSAFSKWSVKETLDFFNNRKMETKIEAMQRVFPKSDKAKSVWDVLVQYMKENNVNVLLDSAVLGFVTNEKKEIEAVKLKNNKHIRAKNFILATGGKSHPETGSTGEGFDWLKK